MTTQRHGALVAQCELSPQLATIFRSLVIFKVDVHEMRTEVDILAQFQQLETLEAYRLRLPTSAVETDLLSSARPSTLKSIPFPCSEWQAVHFQHGRVYDHLTALPRSARARRQCRLPRVHALYL